MSIRVKKRPAYQKANWFYHYGIEHDMLYISRENMQTPLSTLQGSDSLLIDVQKNGELAMITCILGSESRLWKRDMDLTIPKADTSQVCVIEDIDDSQPQTFFTDYNYEIFYARFGNNLEPNDLQSVEISQQIILDIAMNGILAGIWLLDLPPQIQETRLSTL